MKEVTKAKWLLWEKRIHQDISASIQSRRRWQELTEMWNANRALRVANDAQQWIARMYAASAALAVRRQLDPQDDAVSLIRLLSDLEKHAEFWTLTDYLGDVGDGFIRQLNAKHAREWMAPGSDHLDPRIARNDAALLKQTGAVARHYADRVVAHTDRRGLEEDVTYAQLHEALGVVERIALRYHTILTGAAYVDNTMLAHRQFNHKRIFTRAWMRPMWKRATWPPGTVERHGDLWPRVDTLPPDGIAQLVRSRQRIVEELARDWKWHEPRESPIRTALESLGLPSCDAAVQWVRDYLVLRGEDWRPNSRDP